MKATAVALVLLLPVLAWAEEGKITLEFEDAELRSAASTVGKAGGVEVAVTDGVAGRKVTVSFEKATVERALGALASAAGARLVMLEEGVWRIEASASKDALRKKLSDTKVNINFQETPLEDALEFLAQFANTAIAIDPCGARSSKSTPRAPRRGVPSARTSAPAPRPKLSTRAAVRAASASA